MAESNQFRGSTTYAVGAAGVQIDLPEPQHPEQRVTLVFTEVGAGAGIGEDAVLLALPTVAAGAAPFVLSGLRLRSGPVWLRASGDTDVTVAVIVED